MRRLTLLAAILALGLPLAGRADAETLADIRNELAQLSAMVQSLKGELTASGASLQAAGGATALDRMDTIEAELSRLTARTEELQNRVDRVVSDGTNRIGDLEFRICEMEKGCDVNALPAAAPIGGGSGGTPKAAAAAPARPAGTGAGAELAMSEQADFDRAKGVLDQGDFRGAADLFASFAQTYTGGPLTGDAHYYRGEALSQLGDTANAARAYLDGFSGDPDGPRAPDNLLRLGERLADLGQMREACVTLAEVPTRFPGAASATEAAARMSSLGCQ